MMIDLSTPQGVEQFIDKYETMRGQRLANRLGLAGKGSQRLADAVSSFAWNAAALKYCSGSEAGQRIYLGLCENAIKNARNCDQFPSLYYSEINFPSLQAWAKVQRRFIGKPPTSPVSA